MTNARCRVVDQERLSPCFYRLSLEPNASLKEAVPGQFVHLRVRKGLQPFFRRPFSIYRNRTTLDIFYEVVGPGTKALAKKTPGDTVEVLGPLGRGFSLPPKETRRVVMIAGGIGVAPFLALSDRLKASGDYEMILLYGGRDQAHTCAMEDFEANGCRVYQATDDGSVGAKGNVSVLFDRISPDGGDTYVYTCGPWGMMAATQRWARDRGLQGQAACEAMMACGVGVCLGCVIPTRSGYRTVCEDGPVFDLAEVVFA